MSYSYTLYGHRRESVTHWLIILFLYLRCASGSQTGEHFSQQGVWGNIAGTVTYYTPGVCCFSTSIRYTKASAVHAVAHIHSKLKRTTCMQHKTQTESATEPHPWDECRKNQLRYIYAERIPYIPVFNINRPKAPKLSFSTQITNAALTQHIDL